MGETSKTTKEVQDYGKVMHDQVKTAKISLKFKALVTDPVKKYGGAINITIKMGFPFSFRKSTSNLLPSC